MCSDWSGWQCMSWCFPCRLFSGCLCLTQSWTSGPGLPGLCCHGGTGCTSLGVNTYGSPPSTGGRPCSLTGSSCLGARLGGADTVSVTLDRDTCSPGTAVDQMLSSEMGERSSAPGEKVKEDRNGTTCFFHLIFFRFLCTNSFLCCTRHVCASALFDNVYGLYVDDKKAG